MDRVRRLRELWNWLPVFRVAAETEHLPTAAQLLHVSTSSVSRTVRLLEDQLGEPLFQRTGRTLTLNRAGERLLNSVRDAMRMMDEGVAAVTADRLTGAATVAAPRHLLAALVMPAAERLPEGLVPRMLVADGTESAQLRRGVLDLALVERVEPHDDVSIEHVTDLAHGIYCAADHPLVGADADLSAICDNAAFVSSPADRWPIHHPRRVTAHVTDLDLAANMCVRQRLVVLLPDIVGRVARGLVRLSADVLDPTPLYMAYRRPVAHHAITEMIIDALRTEIDARAG